MKRLCLFLLIFISVSPLFSQNKLQLKSGEWKGELTLKSDITLPVNLTIMQSKGKVSFSIMNGNEKIILDEYTIKNDSCYVPFPLFNTELIFKQDSKCKISGRWSNLNKKNYSIPFRASYITKKQKKQDAQHSPAVLNTIAGKWETTFSPNKPDFYKAIGVFEQSLSDVQGTFLTETGDYRFLAGKIRDTAFYLSCFDGTHAFLFTGHLTKEGIINGKFYSGNHYETTWSALRNEQFELNHPDSITYVEDTAAQITFNLPDLQNTIYAYPNSQTENKVVIIQIMGTWCPNCYDETVYFKELYQKYHDQGLEIISVAYEMGDGFSDYAKRVTKYKDKLDLQHTLVIGGNAKKKLSHEHFPFLNEVVSFPTAIFIDRKGEIQRIHTGFSGPGTGNYYEEYKIETEKLILSLLQH